MLLGIVLLTCYFAFARDLSVVGHVLSIVGLVIYWLVPLEFVFGLFSGWRGAALVLAIVGGFVAYTSLSAPDYDLDQHLVSDPEEERRRR